MNYKKPAFWVVVVAIVITVSLLFSFATNPKQEQMVSNLYQGYNLEALMANKTPYVGDNVKGIALIDAMPLPQGIVRDKVELQTEAQPYEMTINFIMNDASGVMIDGAISATPLYRNMVILFSKMEPIE